MKSIYLERLFRHLSLFQKINLRRTLDVIFMILFPRLWIKRVYTFSLMKKYSKNQDKVERLNYCSDFYNQTNSLRSNKSDSLTKPSNNSLRLTQPRSNFTDKSNNKILKTFSLSLARVVALLVSLLFSYLTVTPAYGQEPVGLGELRPLKIGDTIPDTLWDLPLQVVNHPDGKEVIRLSDYRDKKLIILDFWATWCIPCVESLDRLQKLINQFDNEVFFLPSSYESDEKITFFQNQRDWKFISEFNSEGLRRYFSFQGIPFIVWIKDNKIYSFTSSVYLKASNIKDLIDNKPVVMVQRDNVPKIDPLSPVSEVNRLYSLSLGKGHPAMTGGTRSTQNHFSGYNVSFTTMMQLLYSKRIPLKEISSRILWSVSDSLYQNLSTYKTYTGDYNEDQMINNWRSNYLFCYQLDVDSQINLSRGQQLDILTSGFRTFMEQVHKISFKEEDCLRDVWLVKVNSNFPKYQSKINFEGSKGSQYVKMTWAGFRKEIHKYLGGGHLPIVYESPLLDSQVIYVPTIAMVDEADFLKCLNEIGLSIRQKRKKIAMIHVKPYLVKS